MKNTMRNTILLLVFAVITTGCELPEPGDWDFVPISGISFPVTILIAILALTLIISRLFVHNLNTN